MFSFVDSRTLLLLVASQLVLLAVVRCQEEDDRKLKLFFFPFLFFFFYFSIKKKQAVTHVTVIDAECHLCERRTFRGETVEKRRKEKQRCDFMLLKKSSTVGEDG